MSESIEGRWVNSDGYVMVLVGGVLQYEHRLVWQETHGVPIPPGFVVHHRDHDKKNNVPGNLELLPKGEHVRRHNLERRRDAGSKP